MKSPRPLCLPAAIGGGSCCAVSGPMDGEFVRYPRTWIVRKVAK